MTKDKLNEILTLHLAWLRNEPGGVRANLSSANLRGADLSSANLRGANLVMFQCTQHIACYTYNSYIRIGCHYRTIKEWLKEYKAIGKESKYTKAQIEAYGSLIKLCAKLQKGFK